MNRSRQVIIAGAGPGGLALALALRHAGFQPVVHERTSSGSEAGSGFTLWPNAMRALDSLGVGAQLRKLCRPLHGIAMKAANGSELFCMHSSALAHSSDGMGWAMRRSELIDVLAQSLGRDRIRFGNALLDFKQSETEVTASLASGDVVTGCALIGADGLRSSVRRLLFGEQRLRFAGYAVTRGIAPFGLSTATGVTVLGRGRQFGYFPMSPDRVYWFASSNSSAPQMDSPIVRKPALLRAFEGWHTPIMQLIEATPDSCMLRNDIYDIDPLPQWTCGRVTLLGDAAHPATPDLGQGACQAIADAVVLAQCLARNTNIVTALTEYESRRILRTRELTLLARRVGHSGTWTNPLLCGLRNFIIRRTPESVRRRQIQEMFEFQN